MGCDCHDECVMISSNGGRPPSIRTDMITSEMRVGRKSQQKSVQLNGKVSYVEGTKIIILRDHSEVYFWKGSY